MWEHRSQRAALACALLSVALGGGQAQAQTGTAKAKAITLRPLSIVKLRDLDFGTLIAGPAAGTVTIDPEDDSRSTTGGVGAAGGAPQAAQFYTYSRQLHVGANQLPGDYAGNFTITVTYY